MGALGLNSSFAGLFLLREIPENPEHPRTDVRRALPPGSDALHGLPLSDRKIVRVGLLLAADLLPTLKGVGEKELLEVSACVPVAEMPVAPVEDRDPVVFLISMRSGPYPDAELVGRAEEVVDFLGGEVSLLDSQDVRAFVVAAVMGQTRAGGDKGRQEVLVEREPVLAADEEPAARMELVRLIAPCQIQRLAAGALAYEAVRRCPPGAGVVGYSGCDPLVEGRGDKGGLAVARNAGHGYLILVDEIERPQVIDAAMHSPRPARDSPPVVAGIVGGESGGIVAPTIQGAVVALVGRADVAALGPDQIPRYGRVVDRADYPELLGLGG